MKPLHKYNSTDTDVHDIDLQPYRTSLLSPTSKGVHKQWQMDKNDELLVDGYFRQCGLATQHLSTDITYTIASYYTKRNSKGSLKRKIIQLQKLREEKITENMNLMKNVFIHMLILFVFLSFVFSPDIYAMRIIRKYDCDTILNPRNNAINLGINGFLSIGSIVHIITISLLLLFFIVRYFKRDQVENDGWFLYGFTSPDTRAQYAAVLYIVLVTLFFVSYSVVGSIIYSEINPPLSDHQCANTLISWIVLKFIMYIIFVPLIVCFFCTYGEYICNPFHLFYALCVNICTCHGWYFCWFLFVSFLIVHIGVCFGSDIAGLIISSYNDCDVSINGESKWVSFGVNTFLVYGCSLHLGIGFIILCVLFWLLVDADEDNYVERNESNIVKAVTWSVVLFCLASISWTIVGCILYSEMDQSTASNKECADVTIAWIVSRFVECILCQPVLVYIWAGLVHLATYDDE